MTGRSLHSAQGLDLHSELCTCHHSHPTVLEVNPTLVKLAWFPDTTAPTHPHLLSQRCLADKFVTLQSLCRFFGPLESVRVFPEKTFAFVNYVSAVHASAAKAQLDGLPAGSVTGGKPLVIRFQRDVLILPGISLGHGAAGGPECCLQACCNSFTL